MTNPRERGSALLITLVVLLALSAVGMAVVALTEGHERSAAVNTHQKDALYVAEMGLRAGEAVLLAAGPQAAGNLLGVTSSAACPAVSPAVPQVPQLLSQYDVAHLGTYLRSGGVQLVSRPVSLPAPPDGKPAPQGSYSLYVRNNQRDIAVRDNDLSTPATQDNDLTLNLVSVGWVQSAGRIMSVKILEEEYTWVGVNQSPSLQKGKDSGGTSSGLIGG